MKRKNILKFVSLLGIGSFVMLAAASCTTATTPTPNPEPKPDPMPNPPSGGMNDKNTNPGNSGGMDNSAQQLAAARTALTSLLNSQNEKVSLYADYAKIKNTLAAAYNTAKTASDNVNATLENLKSARMILQAAIDKAASDKELFDTNNRDLVNAYTQLKTALQTETATLQNLTQAKYSAIKDHVSNLYKIGNQITTKTLDPSSGEIFSLEDVRKAISDINSAISAESLEMWKANADKFSNFENKILLKDNLKGSNGSSNVRSEPSNYSFAGYSVDITNSSNDTSGWNFAQRKVWTSENQTNGSTDLVQSPTRSTNVSWIYSLSGEGTKYILDFTYYGPSTAYLYFPYKLVNASDESKLGLEYKLNDAAQATAITFGDGEATNGKTPTVNDINIAKITLTDLKFGENKIEFSIPTTSGSETTKVAPMIGNMYLTSDSEKVNDIYNDIFGNSAIAENNSQKTISIDLLKGYSLAAGWSTYVGQFTRLRNEGATDSESQANLSAYLVGFIGGNSRRVANNARNAVQTPSARMNARTLTLYVNAPENGSYYISGSYLSSGVRGLTFTTGESDNTSSVTIDVKAQGNWTTLGTFNSSNTTEDSSSTSSAANTINLKAGLNKIIVSGGTQDNTNAPFIGNLTFTLKNTSSSNVETSIESSQSAQPVKK